MTLQTAIDAHDRLVRTIERSEFASVLNVLMSGDEAEVNEVRALQLLADRGGERVTSRPVAKRYGFSSHSRVRPALTRLQGRGLVDQRDGGWYIVDPLFGEWLRRASPLADRPTLGCPTEINLYRAAGTFLDLCTGQELCLAPAWLLAFRTGDGGFDRLVSRSAIIPADERHAEHLRGAVRRVL